MFRRKLTAGLLVSAFVVSLMGTGTSHAVFPKGTITGAGFLTVHCNLPQFPTNVVLKTGPCTGFGVGIEGGFNNKKTLDLNYCDTVICPVTAIANYLEPCPWDGLIGQARGRVDLVSKAIKPTKSGTTLWNSTLTVPFDWLRIGLIAIVETGKLATPGSKPHPVKILSQDILSKTMPAQKDWTKGNKHKVTSDGKIQQDQQGGLAVAAFAPNSPPPMCPNNGPLPIDVLAVFANAV